MNRVRHECVKYALSHINGNDAYRRGRQGRRGSEGSTLSIRRTSSGQSQTITPSEDGSMSYGLPSDFKLPDVDSKRTTELFSDLNAILQQNNISSPQGEPALSELLQTTGRDRLKQHHQHQHQHHRGGNSNHSSVDLSNSSFDQYLPSSMKRNTGTTSPPVSQSGNGNATTSTLARFLKQAVAHRDSCSSSPVSSLANGGTTPYLSPPNSNSSTSFKQDSSTRRQSMGGKRKSVTANNSPILSGKNDLQLLKPNSLGNDSVTVMVATVTNFTPGVNGTGEVPMTRARSASAVHRRNGSHTGISNTTPIPERSPQRNGADRRSTLVTNSNSNNAAAATTGNGGNQPSVDSSDASHVIVIVRVDSTRETGSYRAVLSIAKCAMEGGITHTRVG
ncbi:hypothetical protein BDF22DRAFT_734761 [Syncephalis plumigaleata]|nr:hypothetical protein BDF22DRAFT_734761 [Syncephalis plumigaleata]